nr:MAG TPA: ATP-dependent RNA helicase [Caudoviricetes sp.]
MKVWHRRKRLKCFLKCLNLNLEGLNDMAKQDIYTWPEGEDDNIDFNAVHEKNKNKTVEDLDQEWAEYLKTLKLESI